MAPSTAPLLIIVVCDRLRRVDPRKICVFLRGFQTLSVVSRRHYQLNAGRSTEPRFWAYANSATFVRGNAGSFLEKNSTCWANSTWHRDSRQSSNDKGL